jgi:hypothetical protein
MTDTTDTYCYLTELTKAEFRAVVGIAGKHGIKGLIGTVMELAKWKALHPKNPVEGERAERVHYELEQALERLEGYEELLSGGQQ